MKKRTAPIFAVIACALAFAAAAAIFLKRPDTAPARVSARVDRTSVRVGESIAYSLTVNTAPGVTAEGPALDKLFTGFIVRDRDTASSVRGARSVVTYRYVIAKDKAGEFDIPPVTVRYKKADEKAWREAVSRGFTVTVKSVAGHDVEAGASTITIGGPAPTGRGGAAGRPGRDEGGGPPPSRVMDIGTPRLRITEGAGPREIPTLQDRLFAALYAAAGVVIVIFCAAFIYARFKKPAPRPVMPYEIAVAKLLALKAGDYYARGWEKAVFDEILAALVEYGRVRYGLREGAMTAKEFIAAFEGARGPSAPLKQRVAEIAALCDLVKYSGYTPSAAEAEAAVAAAKAAIGEMAPQQEGPATR